MGEGAGKHAASKRWFWILIASIFIAGGAVIWVCLPEAGVPETPWKALGERIGDALIIAAILGGTVERVLDNVTKSERSSELARDIAFAILGRHLPNELTERIRSYFDQTVARPEMRITYTISTCTDDPDWFKVKSAIDYEVQNYYDRNSKYTFEYWQEDSPGLRHPSIVAIAKVDNHFYGNLKALVAREPGYLHFRAPETFELTPHGTGG